MAEIISTPEQNQVAAFLAESYKRFFSPNPTFFNVLAWLGALGVLVSLLPLIAPSIAVGASWPIIVRVAGFVLAFVAQFPNKPVAQSATILPFTAKIDGVLADTTTIKTV